MWHFGRWLNGEAGSAELRVALDFKGLFQIKRFKNSVMCKFLFRPCRIHTSAICNCLVNVQRARTCCTPGDVAFFFKLAPLKHLYQILPGILSLQKAMQTFTDKCSVLLFYLIILNTNRGKASFDHLKKIPQW